MLGKITEIIGDKIKVKLEIDIYKIDNLIGKNVIFEDDINKIVGEIEDIQDGNIFVNVIGQIDNNKFIYGSMIKPSFKTICRIINNEEIKLLFDNDLSKNSINVGTSIVYNNYRIGLDINTFFSNHFAILGNSGSGKSYSTSRILQNIFYDAKDKIPFRTNIFLFDSYGEYQLVFNDIGKNNVNINYKVITTDLKNNNYQHLCIPFWLLGTDDIALLLNVDNINQISIIEKALKLVTYFTKDEDAVIEQKNDIIARSLLDIIFSGRNPSEIRNKLISVLTKFKTKDINLDVVLPKGGWSRNIRQCIFVDESGKFADIEVVISYLEQFEGEFELILPDGTFQYGLKEFSLALEFALISEGVLTSDKVFDYSNILKIRLNSLINSDYANYFECPVFITKEGYIRELLTTSNGRKAQIINFNINYIDDRFAKTLVKIYSKLLFDYMATLPNRGSMAFHILLEEAHRYIQHDIDIDLFGYNIFERIAKEGRKYGILLGMISQRPSEISETAISQCSNFLVFKMFHPKDLEFINSILPNINKSFINRLKTFSSGVCIAYGSAFRMPVVIKIDEPNPTPLSQNVSIDSIWYVNQN